MIVLHCTRNNSDKIWVIEPTAKPDGTYTVWYGRRGNKLRKDSVPSSSSLDSRLREKTNKGYIVLPGNYWVKDGFLSEDIHTKEPIQSACWYRIKSTIQDQDLASWLSSCLDNVRQYNEGDACDLSQNSAFISLSNHDAYGKSEYKDGPIGTLLIFALRKYFDSSYVDVVDDNGEFISASYMDLDKSLSEILMAWESPDSYCNKKYTTFKDLKPLAIAIGALEQPVDLSIIKTDKPGMFF